METLLNRDQPNLVNSFEDIKPAKGRTRSFITDTLALFFAALTGYTLRSWLLGTGSIYPFLAGLALFSLAVTLNSFLPKSAGRRYGVIAGETALVVIWFYAVPVLPLAIAAALLLGCFIWGEAEHRSILDRQMGISYFNPAKSRLGKTLTGLTLFGVIVFAALSNQANPIPESFFETIYRPAAQFAAQLYPGVNLQGSAGDFAKELAALQIKNSPELAKLPQQLQNEALGQGRDQILSGLGVDPKQADKPLSSVAYGYVGQFMDAIRERTGGAFIFLWALLLFMIMRSFVFIGDYVLLIAGWLGFEIMFASNLVHLGGETRTKEIIEY